MNEAIAAFCDGGYGGPMLDVIIATMGSIGDEVFNVPPHLFLLKERRGQFLIVPIQKPLDKLIAQGKNSHDKILRRLRDKK
jgi:hypothetical protein